MNSGKVVLGLVFLVSVCALNVPLHDNQQRCMLVFTYSGQDTVKIDMKFSPIPGRQAEEYYRVEWKNTQTLQTSFDTIVEGTYKHEIRLEADAIYQVCFNLNTKRRVQGLQVYYSAHNQFSFEKENIKVPDNLLKSDDLVGTYLTALDLAAIGNKFKMLQERRSDKEEKTFESTREAGNSLRWWSKMEMVAILAAAVYQVYALRKHLSISIGA